MQIPILIEPIEGGRYRARAGEPFVLTADGPSRDEAYFALERLIAERLRDGVEVPTLSVSNGVPDSALLEGETADEWVSRLMREGIEEYRRKEEEEYRKWEDETAV